MSISAVMGISLPRLKDLPLLMLLGFFAVSLHHIALNFGQRYVSAGAASVLAQSTPLFSTLLAHFVFKDRVNTWQWLCLLCGLFGAAVVISGDRGIGQLDAHGLLILLAALSWSLYFALQKHHSHRYDPLTMVCYTVWTGTALLLVYAVMALAAPWIAPQNPFDPAALDLLDARLPPVWLEGGQIANLGQRRFTAKPSPDEAQWDGDALSEAKAIHLATDVRETAQETTGSKSKEPGKGRELLLRL